MSKKGKKKKGLRHRDKMAAKLKTSGRVGKSKVDIGRAGKTVGVTGYGKKKKKKGRKA